MNVILTPPGIEYKKETGKVELGNVIPKEDMRTFWSTIRKVLVLIYPEILHLLHWVVS